MSAVGVYFCLLTWKQLHELSAGFCGASFLTQTISQKSETCCKTFLCSTSSFFVHVLKPYSTLVITNTGIPSLHSSQASTQRCDGCCCTGSQIFPALFLTHFNNPLQIDGAILDSKQALAGLHFLAERQSVMVRDRLVLRGEQASPGQTHTHTHSCHLLYSWPPALEICLECRYPREIAASAHSIRPAIIRIQENGQRTTCLSEALLENHGGTLVYAVLACPRSTPEHVSAVELRLKYSQVHNMYIHEIHHNSPCCVCTTIQCEALRHFWYAHSSTVTCRTGGWRSPSKVV